MKRRLFLWFLGVFAVAIVILTYLIMTGERGLFTRTHQARSIDVTRLDADAAKSLGWDANGLDAVFDHAATLSTDSFVIITNEQIVGAFGDLGKPFNTHSMRKAFLSALVGQHIGSDTTQIKLDSTLQDLAIDDAPMTLTPLQKQATVLDLLNSKSGINHPAAASAGLNADNQHRLGDTENKPGTIWAYNNWDYNALTTVFETRTKIKIANAFSSGIAAPLGMQDFHEGAVFYITEPKLSIHKAALFRLSPRDLAKFGQLYLDRGVCNGQQVIPEEWVNRITTDFSKTRRDDFRWGHGYLWWIPGPDTGLPKRSFLAWGLGNQAVFVIPTWDTVIVHQSDTTEFIKRFIPMVTTDGLQAEEAIMQFIRSCKERANRKTEYCVEHRFISGRDFRKLIALIGDARS